jgi:hypothetical protein
MKKFLTLILFLIPILSSGANFADVRVNEFLPQPVSGPSWVELINSSGHNINLAGWELSHLVTDEVGSTTATTTTFGDLLIPNGGLVSLDLVLATSGDQIIVRDETDKLIHGVSYGDAVLAGTDSFQTPPGSGQSAVTSGNGGGFWSLNNTPTRSWFNQTPSKQTILDSITAAGFTSNLGDFSDWTAVAGLSFSLEGQGSLNLSSSTSLNLTGSADREILQGLATRLDLSTGVLNFNSSVNSILASSSIRIIMSGLPLENYVVGDIVVYNSSGVLVTAESPDYPLITDFSFASGTMAFTTSHFMTFVVPTTTPPVVPDPVVPSGGGGGGSSGLATTTPPVGRILGANTFYFSRMLRPGMSGVDVQELQKILQAEKFFKVKITKYFGLVTQKALVAWQKKHKIRPATGVVGKPTLKVLNSL